MSTPLRERPDAPLGTLIFRAGLLPAETIENALEEGVKTGRRLGEILIERGLLHEEDLTRLLAGQKGLPFISLRSEPIDPGATGLLSEDQARLFSALPIRFEEGLPLVAVADPTNDVLNRNIREALGQDVRFVVAGRTELSEVIGEAYSGTLRMVATEPPTEPEAPAEEASLAVDSSFAPPAEEAPVPDYEPEPVVDPEPEPPPAVEAPEPAPALEAQAFDAPAYAPEPESVAREPVAPEPVPPEPEPAPAFEPVTTFEAAPAAEELQPAAPSFDAPAAPEPAVPVATEPAAPLAPPETNGLVTHDLEDDLLPPEPALPIQEPAVPAEEPAAIVEEPAATVYEPAAAPAAPADTPTANGTGFTVSVRLTSGEQLTVAECADIGEAKGYAKALTKQLGTTDPDDWPFVNGRFLKPDTILSVDVEPS